MKILYSKYTDYRNKQFQIYTKILEQNGCKQVVKEPVYPEGGRHVKHIAQMYGVLQAENTDDRIAYCPCRYEDGKVFFDFIEGKTMKSRIEEAVRANKKEEVRSLVQYYCTLLAGSTKKHIPFQKTDAFTAWFGDIEGLDDESAVKVANVDCNVGNVIMANDKETIIDYEWVFDFPIPIGFILYVNLSWLYHFDVVELQSMFRFSEVLHIAEIEDKKIPIYELMEKRHGEQIDIEVKTGVNMLTLKDVNLKQPLVDLNRVDMVIVYNTQDGEIQEKIEKRVDAMSKHTKIELDVPERTQTVQIMLTGGIACSIKWFYIYADGVEVSYQVKNGYSDGAYIFFDAELPLIEFKIDDNVKKLEITGHYYFTADEDLIDVYHRNALLRTEINRLRALETELNDIKNSKSWMMVQKMNGMIDKVRGV